MGDKSSLQKKPSCAHCVPHSLHSWEDSSTIHLHRCLILRRVSEYSRTTNVIQSMMPVIPLEDIIVALR